MSGLLNSKGNPPEILTLALTGAFQVRHDERILAEHSEVLARPRFNFDPIRVRDVLNILEEGGLSFVPSRGVLNLPDPDDEPFLAVAPAASADHILTGNMAEIIHLTNARECA